MKVRVMIGYWLKGGRVRGDSIERMLALFIGNTSLNALPPIGSNFFFDHPEPALGDMCPLGWNSKVLEIVTLPDFEKPEVSQHIIILENVDFVEERQLEGLLYDQLKGISRELQVHYERLGKIGRTVFQPLLYTDSHTLWKYHPGFEETVLL